MDLSLGSLDRPDQDMQLSLLVDMSLRIPSYAVGCKRLNRRVLRLNRMGSVARSYVIST